MMTEQEYQDLMKVKATFLSCRSLQDQYQLRLLIPAAQYDDAVARNWIDKDNLVWERYP
jgi:hypothetical protein